MGHAAHHDHDDHAEAHDDHDDHHEPPPPEEPHTPWWLTLLGAILFVSGGIFFLVANAEPMPEAVKAEQKPAGGQAQPQTPPPSPRPGLSAMPMLRKAAEEIKR